MSDKWLQGERVLLDFIEIRALLYKAEEESRVAVIQDRDIDWLQRLANGEEMKSFDAGYPAVRERFAKIRSALGAKTTAEAVAIAIRKGLIQ